MTQILQRTVLFADLRGSTSLYETLGNAEATTVVTQSVGLVAQIVHNAGGIVVKTLGDGLMAVFFYVIGLELKRELTTGELSNPRTVLLPVAAAIFLLVVMVPIRLVADRRR